MFNAQKCPICLVKVQRIRRYPYYVCQDCCKRAVDKHGQSLNFYNESLSGGYVAFNKNTDEKYDSHIFFIDGVKCYANEAHFGGIVIEADKFTFRKTFIKIVGAVFEKIDNMFQK